MGIDRRVNLFDLTLVAPPEAGQQEGKDIDLNNALSEVAKLCYDVTNYSLPSNRYHYIADRRARFGFDFKPTGSLYVGIIGRNDLDGGQTEAAGVITDLNLGSDAGLHYATHFVLDPVKRRILLESNALGPRSGDVSRYLQGRLGSALQTGVELCQLKPVIDSDMLNRFENETGKLAAIEIGVLRENIGRLANSSSPGVASELVVVSNSMQAVADSDKSIELLTFQLQRKPRAKKGGLDRKWKPSLAWLARNKQEEVHKLKARVESSPDDRGTTEWVDLLSERTGRLIPGISTRTSRNIIVSEHMHARMLEVYAAM